MPERSDQIYSFDEDGMLRLQKDLNYMFNHLDDNNVRRLYTEYCQIKSEAGETRITGPQLIMTGDPGTTNSTTVRLKAGWDSASSEFVFNLYDSLGNPTIEIDSTGDAVFRGSINTAKDVYIGQRLIVNWDGSTVPPPVLTTNTETGIFIRKPGTTEYMASIYTSGLTSDIAYEVLWVSSEAKRLQCKYRYTAYMLAGLTTDGVSNSTDYIAIKSANNRCYINTDSFINYTTETGTFLGNPFEKDVFIGETRGILNQIPTIRDLGLDLEDCMYDWYSRNHKKITNPTTNWSVFSSDIALTGTTRIMESTRGVYMYPETTGAILANFCGLDTTQHMGILDLTQFYNGTPITSDSILVVLAWIEDNDYVTETYVRLGEGDGTTSIFFNLTSSVEYGWNLLRRKWGAITGRTGTTNIDFTNISFARIGFFLTTARPNVGGYIDYIGIIAPDQDFPQEHWSFLPHTRLSTSYPWSAAGDDWYLYSAAGNIMSKYGNKPAITQLPILDVDTQDMYIRQCVLDFDCAVQFTPHLSNEGPAIKAVGDSSDSYAQVELSSGVLRLRGRKDGSTFGDYINCESFPVFSECEIGMKRKEGSIWKAYFRRLDDGPETHREVNILQGGAMDYLESADIYLGTVSSSACIKITGVEIIPNSDEQEFLLLSTEDDLGPPYTPL